MCEEVKAFFEKWLMRASHTRVMLGGKAKWVKLPRGGGQQLRGVRADGMKKHAAHRWGVRRAGKVCDESSPEGNRTPIYPLGEGCSIH